jgi:hypothetical protein
VDEIATQASDDASLRTAAEPELFRFGRAMVTPAARLLARIRAPFVTVAAFRGDPSIRLVPWTDRLEPGQPLDMREAAFWPETKALVEAGSQALRHVARRWPDYALPDAIGLVSDGTGLAVSGENPSGLTARWLLDQIEFGSPASIVIPFDPQGIWALVSPMAERLDLRQCH